MIKVALLGFGVVGGGAATVLTDNRSIIAERAGEDVEIKYILDLRDFPDSPFGHLVVHDFNVILNDPEVKIIAEMMGGSHPAYDFTKAALEAGKSVVTSNKECVARFGAELCEIARAHGVRYMFEASVGGGIPIIRPMMNDLAPNNILAVDGIVNGTTNYILTKMTLDGSDFGEVLADAQAKGYAERNPAADVEGLDAARKIVILAALSFGKLLNPNNIHCEGITGITAEDAAFAKSNGYAVKLIGHTELMDGKVLAMVSPRLVPVCSPLAGVSDVFNGILVDANMLGECMFYGKGAGKLPTASAVVADIIDIVAHMGQEGVRAPKFEVAGEADYADFSAYKCRTMLAFEDKADSYGKLEKVFGVTPKLSHGRAVLITEELSEAEVDAKIAESGLSVLSRIRVL
jgi:homoserine dehydrogenase